MEQRCKHCKQIIERGSKGNWWTVYSKHCPEHTSRIGPLPHEPAEQLEPEPKGEGQAFWTSFLDGFTMSGLFGNARIPGDSTRMFAEEPAALQIPDDLKYLYESLGGVGHDTKRRLIERIARLESMLKNKKQELDGTCRVRNDWINRAAELERRIAHLEDRGK